MFYFVCLRVLIGNLPLRFALKVLRTQKHLLKCMMQKLPSAAHALSFIEVMHCDVPPHVLYV